MAGPDKLPYSELRASASTPEDNYLAWRDAVWPLFDADVTERADVAHFSADLSTYQMGPMLVGCTRMAGTHRFRRSPAHIAATGLDLFLIQLFVEGGDERVCWRAEARVGAGDIGIADLTRPVTTVARDFTNLSFVVPRTMFTDLVPDVDSLHGLVLRGATTAGRLVGEHMRAVWSHAPLMSMQDSPIVAKGMVGFLATFANATDSGSERTAVAALADKLITIRRYIDRNLASPDLGTVHLCEKFGLSRASLYRLFEPLGGVADYIRKRRLQRTFAELTAPKHRHRTLAEIAHAAGFKDSSTFARAFRTSFGMSPNEARILAAAGHPIRQEAAEGEAQHALPYWLRMIDRA